MPSFWSKLYYAFGWMTISLNQEPGLSQYPTLGHNRPPLLENQPPPEAMADGPKFKIPNTSGKETFECDYSRMKGYTHCNDAKNRSCWLEPSQSWEKRYDIGTDYEVDFPVGTIRKITLEAHHTNIKMADGKREHATVYRGKNPKGETVDNPWIQACWGDDIEVCVINKMDDHGTTIHWHGIRMFENSLNDGVNAITQCPIAPGSNFTYRFHARQYGTTWYHSHYGLQYGDGALGALTIHGPSSDHYDEEAAPVMISDFSYESFFSRWRYELGQAKNITRDRPGNGAPRDGTPKDGDSEDEALLATPGRALDGIQIGNFEKSFGKSIKTPYKPEKSNRDFTLNFARKKKYLLRLINHSVESTFVFSIDGHSFKVVSADFVPVHAYERTQIVIGIGQRYNIIILPNEETETSRFWIRTWLAHNCSGKLDGPKGYELAGVVQYPDEYCGGGDDLPRCKPENRSGNINLTCQDEPYGNPRPVHEWHVGKASNLLSKGLFNFGVDYVNGAPYWPKGKNLTKWNMYSNPMWLRFGDPTTDQVLNQKKQHFNDPSDANLVVVDEKVAAGSWLYFVLTLDGSPRKGRDYFPVAHPVHLHGHDFAILQQSTEPLKFSNLNSKLDNPPRRDVVLVPRDGFTVIAFKADNSGIWLMHCHIAWHASMGLAMQLLENVGEFEKQAKKIDKEQLKSTCDAWKTWRSKDPKGKEYQQDESGI